MFCGNCRAANGRECPGGRLGVVAVDPSVAHQGVGGGQFHVARPLPRPVGEVVALGPGVTEALEARGARDTHGLVVSQRLPRVVSPGGQADRQGSGVLDGLGRALGVEGEHGVRRVTEQGGRPGAPARQGRPVQQRPPPGCAGGADQRAHPGVPAGELGGKLGHGGRGAPGLFDVLAGRGEGDQVDHALLADRVVHQVMAGAQPDGLGGAAREGGGVLRGHEGTERARARVLW